MAKFRERFLIVLLSLAILALIAVLSVCQISAEGPSSSNIPGMETFNNLKRSRLNYEIIDFDLFDQRTAAQVLKEAVSNNNNIVEVSRNDNIVEALRNNNINEASINNNVVEVSNNNKIDEVSNNKDIVVVSKHDNIVEALRNNNVVIQTKKTSPENNANNDVLSRPPNMTLILSESRSGSTWVLDAMSHPENSMMFFEPLNAKPHARFLSTFANNQTPEVMIKFRQNKLSQICSCNLTSTIMGGVSGWQRNYKDRTGLRMNNVTDHCFNNYITRIAKTIRLYNISELSALPRLGCSNFKVIHLVRDPRAVLLSRIETFHELYDGNHKLGPKLTSSQRDFDEEYMRRAAHDYCSHHVYNFGVGSKAPLWLQKRYKMIRYEDIALNPMESIKSLFSFTNQIFTDEMEMYVYDGSHNEEGHRGGYGVKKDSSIVAQAWKGRLIWEHVKVIQEECKTFLNLFDYEVLSEGS